jgi:dipeptidyl aminopeptidase/acylaminoacyl peptidase
VLRILAAAGIAAAVWSPVAGQQSARRTLTLDDLSKVRAVSDPQVSPDGGWVAYVVGTSDLEKDKRDSDIWMVSWDGANQVRLTATAETSETMPRWSADGKYLAFLTSRGDEDEKKKGAQVWLLDRRGGEAARLTDIKGGVSDYVWSPDSTRLALIVNDPDPDDEPEKKEGWKRKTAPPIVIDRYHFKADGDGYLGTLRQHLAVFDVAARTHEVITPGVFDESSPSWSPDGRTIAFVSNRAADPDRTADTHVFTIEAKTGAVAKQLSTAAAENGGRPSWSPDGRTIAYLQGDETKFYAYGLDKLAVVPVAGGAGTVVTAALDRPVRGPLVWRPDGRGVTVVVTDDRTSYVATVAIRDGGLERLTSGQRTVSAFAPRAAGGFAVVTGTGTDLGEVHALDGTTLRRLTHQNDEWTRDLQLGAVEDFTSTSKDGTEVHSVVIKPPSYTAGKPYPMLLMIHGGPNGQDEHGFYFERQWLAANGYVVLSPNYRGSAGRGAAFQKAIYAEWGHKEVVDLLGAVDAAVAAGLADPARLGIGGWSYGGILTDYTIATDTRFKAAVSGAGSALQLSMYGTDQYTMQYDQELGPPWKSQDLWIKLSYPMFHADRIKTPTLFLSGLKDFNVPTAGAEQMYQALKSLGVDTQLILYPGQAHGITMPSYARDRLARYVAWFDKYLKTAASPRIN